MNSVTEHLRWMCDRLKAGKPFCHLRFNDGEAIAMGLAGGGDANCDGHPYHADMAAPLRQVFRGMAESENCLIGSIMETDEEHPTAVALDSYLARDLDSFGVRFDVTVGEFWCQEEKVEGWDELRELFGLLRQGDETVLVCNERVQGAARCLGASEVVVVPAVDAWSARKQAMRRLLECSDRARLVWCCGFPGKVWAWMLRTLMPGTTHIDAGHTFDGVYGNLSREWMKRDSEMSRFYFGTFAPWVRGES